MAITILEIKKECCSSVRFRSVSARLVHNLVHNRGCFKLLETVSTEVGERWKCLKLHDID